MTQPTRHRENPNPNRDEACQRATDHGYGICDRAAPSFRQRVLQGARSDRPAEEKQKYAKETDEQPFVNQCGAPATNKRCRYACSKEAPHEQAVITLVALVAIDSLPRPNSSVNSPSQNASAVRNLSHIK